MLQGRCHDGLLRWSEAEACYSASIALQPENHMGYLLRGVARMHAKRSADAIEDFDHVLELQPKLTAALVNRAIACLACNRGDVALADLTQAIRFGRDDALVYFLRSHVHESLGNTAKSKADQQLAMQRQPVTALGWTQRSLVTRHADPQQALRELDQALAINPHASLAIQNKAALLSQLGQNEAAMKCLSRLIELVPARAAAYLARGLVKAKLGQREAAIADGKRGLKLDSSADRQYQMARIYAAASTTGKVEDLRRSAALVNSALASRPRLVTVIEGDQELVKVLERPEVHAVVLTAKSLIAE
jgi:tetratricopeptide (TPR) repeat protein